MPADKKNTPRYVLSLDSAMTGCASALFDVQSNKTFFRQNDAPRGQAEMLVPMAQAVISEAGIEFSDIDFIATTTGPGSFTGVRIGISAARSFALALDIPVMGLLTTELLAAGYLKEKKADRLLVLIETKRADYYAQDFDAAGHAISAPVSLTGEEVTRRINDDTVIIGDAVFRFTKEFQQGNYNIDDSFTLPDPEIMGYIALQKIKNGYNFDNQKAEPVYLKAADVSEPKVRSRII